MKKIAIIAAMSKEIAELKKLLSNAEEKTLDGIDFITGDLGGKEIILTESGIGKVCAAVKTTELINLFKPDCVINSGVAGGIGDKVEKMDVVVGVETVYNDVWCLEPNSFGQVQGFPARFGGSRPLLEKLNDGDNGGVTVHKGLICSGDKFITGIEAVKSMREAFSDGLAVDMESCAVAQVCHMKNVPFLALRIISDNPLKNNDNFNEYQDFWGEMAERSFKVLKKLLMSL